ncbi:undecaprenyl/decaprenyl-phosphate alpha-N-acetylglucosaminyl 1-phosphate transferase [Flavobacteriaceae bacterium]|nr:undecaprenyl/decaprenyl-phosphate alpha-N-acetylglucosaminyl 1-phosphate transferase [Flavobacteriaceae bacterium]MDC6473172.1 MraY family glycosyltransferase [Flavobacteriaceae bacterium]
MTMTIIILSSSIILSLICLIFYQRLFIEKNRITLINERSSHSAIATSSGGIAIFTSIFSVSCILYILGIEAYEYKLLVPLGLITLIGIYDDIYEVDYKLKFMFQIITAKILIDQGFIITNLHGIFGFFELSSIIAQLLTIFIIVSIINSINFIDGVDGLALGVLSIFIIAFEYFSKNYFEFDNLSLLILGSTLPLWYFNYREKKKIFLGDAGSLMIGAIISIYTISILSNQYLIRPEYDLHKILFVISILFYPIIDIIRVCFLRIYKGKSPFVADKNHIHHLLLNRFTKHSFVVMFIISITLCVIILFQVLFN